MKASAAYISELFQGNVQYIVPNFQRRYRWQKEQWALLFDDLCKEAETEGSDKDGHFLGSIVLHRSETYTGGISESWLVIDGQQRLTSVLLLFAALRDAARFTENLIDASTIETEILSNFITSNTTAEKLVPTKLDREQFVQTVRQRKPSGRFGEGYDYFLRMILQYRHASGEPISALLGALLQRMLVVRIEVERRDAINSIFNTLNSKGLPLNAGDLIKNELLLSFDEETSESLYLSRWAPIEEALVTDIRGKIDERRLVTFFWARELPYSRHVTHKNLFTVFEERHRAALASTTDPRSRARIAEAEIDSIWVDFQNYRMMEDHRYIGNRIDLQIKSHLQFFKSWSSPIHVPIVLWILRGLKSNPERVSEVSASKSLTLLKSFLVRRALCGYPSNNLNKMLAGVPYILQQRVLAQRSPEKPEEVLVELFSKPGFSWPTDEEVSRLALDTPILKSLRSNQVRALLELATGNTTRGKSKLLTGLPKNVTGVDLAGFNAEDADLDYVLQVLPYTLGNVFLPGSFSDALKLEPRLKRAFTSSDPDTPLIARIHQRTNELVGRLLEVLPALGLSAGPQVQNSGEDLVTGLLEIIPERSWTSLEILSRVTNTSLVDVHTKVSSLPAYHARFVREYNGELLSGLPASLAEQVKLEDRAAQSVFTQRNFLNEDDLYILLGEAEDNAN